MKKIFTLILLSVAASTMVATPHPPLSPRKAAREEKNLHLATSADRHLVVQEPSKTAKQMIKPSAKATTPIKHATQEEIVLNFDKFAYFQYYSSSKDWFLSMSCNDPSKPEYGYVVKFDYFAPADNPFGTFTTSDFDMTYSLIGINKEVMVFYEEVTLTVSQVKTGNMSTIIAEATILGDDGNTYKVKCVEETISPAEQYDVVINDATLTQSDNSFAINGKNKLMNANLVINNPTSILGTYTQSDIDLNDSRFVYNNTTIEPMQMTAEITSATVNGKLSYVATVSILSTDTIQYNITLNSPLPEPTQQVNIVANNLIMDDSYVDWYGKIFADAYTSLWLVYLEIPGYYIAEGTYSNGVVCSLTNRFTDEEITALQVNLNVMKDKNGRWMIVGVVRGSDNVIYNLNLSWTVPAAKEVVKVTFPESAEAVYWVQDNDLQLSNLTDDYYVSLDVINVPVGEPFNWDQMDHDFSGIIDFHASEYIEVADAINGMIEQVGDTTKMSVSLIAFNEIQYDVTLWYAAPTPTQTVEMTIPVEFNNLLEDGAFQLHNANSSDEIIVSFTPLTYELEGTFVNDGMFGRLGAEGGQYDFLDDYTYIALWNTETNQYDMFSISKGEMIVTLDGEDITAQVDVVCNNAVRYLLTLTSSTYEPKPDENYTPVDRTYTAEDVILLDDQSQSTGKIICKLHDVNMSEMLYLLFFADTSDADIVIPEGIYPIDASGATGTVYANPGIQNNEVYPSFYAEIVDGYLQVPLWTITQGTVTVSKTEDNQLYFEVNATNDYQTPIHIIYNGGKTITGIENTNTLLMRPSKYIKNGQLRIRHNNFEYNATGAIVK